MTYLTGKHKKNHILYVNILRNLLVGHTSLADQVLSVPGVTHQLELHVRNLMDCNALPTPNLEIEYHRGILLPDCDAVNNTLKPLPSIKTISFTEDIEIAKDFANIDSEISSYVKQINPDYRGYLISHRPKKDEILFHYSWFDTLGLNNFPELDKDIISEQKELILFQTNRLFNLMKV